MHPILHLEAVRTLTHPKTANIFEIIAESNHVTFSELIKKTKLGNESLSGHLNKLFENYLIKVIMSKEGEKYTKYVLTKKGEYFHDILHDVFAQLSRIPERYETYKFVIDAKSFWNLYKKLGAQKIGKLFRDSKIIFTNNDFSQLLEMNEENDDMVLEEFLYSEQIVEVPRVYQDSENGVMTEFYLRRSSRLEKMDSQIVALAADLDASLISENAEILQAAKKLGILCVNLDSILQMNIEKPIGNQFYIEANKKYDPTNIEFLIEKSSLEAVKKN